MQSWQIVHSPWMQLLLGVVSVGAIVYFLFCIALTLWQNRLIFFPSAIIKNSPGDFGLAFEEVWMPVLTWKGKVERLHGWWIPSLNPKADVLLYLHGNGGNISANLGHARRFHQLGFSVLLIDYRGYGRSKGKFPTEAEVYRDAQAAWDYLVRQRQINPRDIFIYGHSLGGAIAIDLAVRRPQAAGLIVENTFTSMGEQLARQGVFKLFPVKWLLSQRFDSLSKLKLLRVPLLLIHGARDRTVPAQMGQNLYEAASVPKQLLLVPHAGHNNVAAVSEEEYLRAVSEFYQGVRRTQLQLAKG
ncbi:alpha/beta superfamily hydrolase [Pleurocapsa sp. PCC 7327]|uniref:alpha/beta hydrolase n=1 Tax=Pleurocapsa sp. PCC 7327 TaxID=118163 RepID=UPI00029FBD8E|nr:alpha/beta fold hydrolase [Pleurocapsa sp. PCC 7327]AFY76393.1 alpha/beta superfamily hydrolase [Pleurocapsa sp. PCC 7327]